MSDPSEDPSWRLDRRRLIELAGIGTSTLLAGCAGDGDGQPSTTRATTHSPTTTRPESTVPTTSTRATSTTTQPTTEDPTTTTGMEGSGSHVGLDDGFATPAPWLEDDPLRIIKVTEPTRDALETALVTPGPRVIVFETSGTINLDWEPIEIPSDKCWVAGQTAPSPGISLIRGSMFVSANDCVVQHIRVRRGERTGQGEGKDAISTGDDTSNNVIDHVSAFWGRDENLSVGYRSNNTTVANCLIAEGLTDPAENSNGTLVGNNATGVAIMGCLYAKCLDRNPRLKDGTRSVVTNSLGYHFNEACNMSGGPDITTTSFVGNGYIRPAETGDAIVDHDGGAYVEDNFVIDPPLDDDQPLVGAAATRLDTKPQWPDGYTPLPSSAVEDHTRRYAGARPADRDAHDARIIEELDTRSGSWVGHQSEVGGWTSLPIRTRRLEVPDENLRAWLERWALAVEHPEATPP